MLGVAVHFHLAAIGLRLYRERRRLALVACLAFAAGFLLYAHYPHRVFGMPLPVFTGLFYAVFVTAFAVLTSQLLPRLRHVIELFALSRLAFAIFGFTAPGLVAPVLASPFMTATVVVAGAIALQKLAGLPGLADHADLARSWLDDRPGRARDLDLLARLRAGTQAEPAAA